VFGGGTEGELLSAIKGGGHHGYDPDMPEMYTGFIGYGAGFKSGASISQVSVKDIAPIIATLLGLKFKSQDGILYPGLVTGY
jgi:predicted AlkP superfamily phosphohydrolase/phosphomutase